MACAIRANPVQHGHEASLKTLPQAKVQALEAQVQELQSRLAALNVEREQHKQQLAALSERVTTVAPQPPPPEPEEKPAEVRMDSMVYGTSC